MATSQAPPVCTVYVRSIDERVKPAPLRAALQAIFEEFGTVVDILIKTNLKSKGQAFVVLDSPDAAARAAEEVQGFEIFGTAVQTAVARMRSDATVLAAGNEDEFDQHKRRRIAERDKRKAFEEQQALKRPAGTDPSGRPDPKRARGVGLKPNGPAQPTLVPDEYLPPNRILFVQNIPEDCDKDQLTDIFGRFEGFLEVRMVPGRRGIAFVEYDAEAGAITAKENTAGMALNDEGKTIKVTYQRQ